ncbi:hypothetical protein EDC01DRAFT_630665 [Geopyxis carbonaria]|nr:hypothetical protein EDC01DRAFT_630665 [Geopyxis carbonaria]
MEPTGVSNAAPAGIMTAYQPNQNRPRCGCQNEARFLGHFNIGIPTERGLPVNCKHCGNNLLWTPGGLEVMMSNKANVDMLAALQKTLAELNLSIQAKDRYIESLENRIAQLKKESHPQPGFQTENQGIAVYQGQQPSPYANQYANQYQPQYQNQYPNQYPTQYPTQYPNQFQSNYPAQAPIPGPSQFAAQNQEQPSASQQPFTRVEETPD